MCCREALHLFSTLRLFVAILLLAEVEERLEVQARNADAFRGRCIYGCHACGGFGFLQGEGDAGSV